MSSTVKEGWKHVYPGTDYGYFEKGRVRGDDITVSLDKELDMEVNIRDGGDNVTAFIPIMEVIKPLLESHGYTVERKVQTVIINNVPGESGD